ncbi:MAG TPA: FHA domain-containing protein [Pirellulales bacterium]|jgi:adenylate cyclase|nr:FHA domain-containing protein [Pirellulales bacterium]
MKAKLVLISPDAETKEFKLALPTKIGRGQEAKLKLLHPLVSRVHCEIYELDEQLMVRDMASLNGTFVDDERVADEMALPSGCRLTVGSAQFHVLYGDDYDRPPPAKKVKSDAPTKLADETVPMSSVPAGVADGEQDSEPWNLGGSPAEKSESHQDTRTLDFDFLSDDEPPETVPGPAAGTAAPAKPAAPVKPAAAAKPGANVAPSKPGATKPAAAGRPQNPAEMADDEEIAASGRAFSASGRAPAAASAQTPIPPADESDEMLAEPAEEPASGEDDADLDDFFRSIM